MTNSNAIPDAATAPDFRMLRPWLAVDEPDNQGEWAMHCPLHEDRNASASVNFEKSLWRCFAGCPDGEIGELLHTMEQMGVEGGGTTVTAKGDRGGFTADVVDLRTGKRRRSQKLPSGMKVAGWHNALMRNHERLSELFEKRGLTRETIESFKLGWDEDAEAYTIPFVEDGQIVNVKWYRVSPQGEQRKMWGVTGHNGARLYPGPPEDNGEPVLICAGEMDTLLAIQYGFEAVTGSGGETNWRDEWNRHFTGRTVYVVYDRDKAGDDGYEIVRQQLAGKAAEVRKVILPLEWTEKDGKDLTDLYHEVGADQFAQELRSLLDGAPEQSEQHAAYEGLVIPDGWEVNDAGISWIKDGFPVPFSHAPLVIRERLLDDEGTAALTVAWRVDGRWRDRTFDRDELHDSQRLKRQSKYDGSPFNSGNAAKMSNWIVDLEAANIDRIPVRRMTRWLGWLGDGPDDFVANPEDSDVEFHGPKGSEELAESLTRAGTLAEWQDAVDGLRDHPRAALGVYAALAAPLLRILEVGSFTVDWSCETSRGKTTTLQIAASCWGAPGEGDGFMQNWHGSRNAIEAWAGLLRGVPLLLDETKMAKPEDVASILYDIAASRGRGRAARNGGLRETATWNTVVCSTGEQPITTFSEDGGTRPRAVEVQGPPFGDGQRGKFVRNLSRNLRAAHGHAGPMFAAELLARRDEWPALRERYEDLIDELCEELANPVAQRRAKFVAVMRLAAELVVKFGVLDWEPDPLWWNELLEETADAEHEDPAKTAMQQVCQWAWGHERQFVSLAKNHSPRSEGWGWAGRWDSQEDDVCYLPDVLRRILRDRGHAYDSVVKIWGDRGWIMKDSAGKNTRQTRTAGQIDDRDGVRMVVIPAEIYKKFK